MKLKLIFIFCMITLVSSFSLYAKDAMDAGDQGETEYKNMEQMMGSLKLEKKQIESMVDKLVASGRINPEEAAKAKRELASMNDNDLENIKTKAMAQVKDKRLLDH